MSTAEQKLKNIESMILQKANKRANDIISKAIDQKNQMLEEKEIEILQKKYKEINKITLDIRRKMTQYISDFEIKNKKKLLLQRDDFCNRIFENVFTKLCKFTKQEEYTRMFGEILRNQKIEDLSTLVFYIKSGDIPLRDTISDIFGENVKIEEAMDIKIGGLRIINCATGVCHDETLDTKLEEQKSWFYSNSDVLSF